MKGTITLQPLRKEKINTKGWPVFDAENAIFGHIDHFSEGKIKIQEGNDYTFFLEDVKEFMVKGEDGNFYTLCGKDIDMAMGCDWWDYYHMFGEQKGKELTFEIDGETASVVLEAIEMGQTERGFSNGEFTDQYDNLCSIQHSSIATKDCIWLGINDANPIIMASKAAENGVSTSETTGWVPFPIPDDVLLHTRMHLSREDVKRMLPLLQRFVETGSLTE